MAVRISRPRRRMAALPGLLLLALALALMLTVAGAGGGGFLPAGLPSAEATSHWTDYDTDGDNLIEIRTLDQLNAVRHDVDGDGVSTIAAYAAAFPNRKATAPNAMGCAATCIGYELATNLTFDTNGDGSVTSADGHSYTNWAPIYSSYTARFQGNGHTIAHLTINRPTTDNAGLFRHLGSSGSITGVGLPNANVTGEDVIGALVGVAHGTVAASWSSGTVSAVAQAGGLIGRTYADVIACYSRAAVTSRTTSSNVSLGAGGLIGIFQGGYVRASYAAGPITSHSPQGLTAVFAIGYNYYPIVNSYWDRQISGTTNDVSNVDSTVGSESKTTSELQTPTGYTGIYANWNLDVDNADSDNNLSTGRDAPWDFGANSQYPILKYGAGYSLRHQGRTAGIALTNTSGSAITTLSPSENGSAVSYRVALIGAPTASVTITVTSSDPNVVIDGPDAGNTFGDSASVTFTTSNWSTARTFRVRALDNTNFGNESVKLTHAATGASSGYHGDSKTLAVSVTDDDSEFDYDADGDNLIEIRTLAQLDAMRHDRDGDGVATHADYAAAFPYRKPTTPNAMGCAAACKGYELAADLDFAGSDYASGAGWVPIGKAGAAWTGDFIGNGHSISNLTINSTDITDVGLFGEVNGGAIASVGLLDVNITPSYTNASNARFRVGALAGVIVNSTVRYSYATGTLRTDSNAGTNRVYTWAGGLIGDLANNAAVSSSWSSVVVTVSSNSTHGWADRIGGLAGTITAASSANRATVTASYATGSISGNRSGRHIGGLIGIASHSTITACYATGRPGGGAGGATWGGLLAAGWNNPTITDSYWDRTTSSVTWARGGGASKTTSQLQNPTGYTGDYADWNVDVDGQTGGDDPWNFGSNSQYPVLKFGYSPRQIALQQGVTPVDYDADDDGLIEVDTLAELNAIRYDLDGNGIASDADYATYQAFFPGLLTCAFCRGYELTTDLDFDTGTAGDRTDDLYHYGGVGWTPIGTVSAPYTGDFAGRGYDIRNLYINTTTNELSGLFGHINGGLITGVGLPAVDITVTYTNNAASAANLKAGALAAMTNGSPVVRSSYATGGISITASGTGPIGIRAGGLMGDLRRGAPIVAGSWSSVAVTTTTSTTSSTFSSTELGGLVGYAASYFSQILASYATGDVTATRTGSVGSCSVGGLLAGGWNGNIVNGSYSIGTPGCTAPGSANVAGLVNSSSVTNSYWDQTASGVASGGNGTARTTMELQSPTRYQNTIYAGWNLDLDNADRDRKLTTGGDNPWNFGSDSEYPTLHYDRDAVSIDRESNPGRADVDYDGDNNNLIDLTTLAQLEAIRYDLDGAGVTEKGWRAVVYAKAFPGLTRGMGCRDACRGYELKGHLDFTGSKWASGRGWSPIGTGGAAGAPYAGEFIGNGYTISNLYINAPDDANLRYAGLFGAVSGTVARVGLPDVNIAVVYNRAGGSHYFDAGALAGEATGTIRASWSTGTITTSTTATGSSAPHVRAGGLVGHAETGAMVAASWSSVAVSSTSTGSAADDDRVGGLVGTASAAGANGTRIIASYATGDVSASRSACAAGGLIGNTWNTEVTASYAIGAPTCSDSRGGLIGVSGGTGAISNSYWDSDASGVTGAGAGAAKTTGELQTPTEYGASGDFSAWNVNVDGQTGNDDPWDFGTSSQYPILKFDYDAYGIVQQRSHTETDYDRDDDNLIDITELAQLDAVRYDLDGDGATATGDDAAQYARAFPGLVKNMGCPDGCRAYELAAHLDFDTNGDGSVTSADETLAWNGGAGWVPIGTDSAPYTGKFYGQGYTISNLFIDSTGVSDVGLFGRINSGAIIESVGLLDVDITAGYTNSSAVALEAGALVGLTVGAAVRYSYATGALTVSSADQVRILAGGLVGSADTGSTVAASWSSVEVTATSTATTGHADRIGGLVGRAGASNFHGTRVIASYATGDVRADRNGCQVGGLLGQAYNTNVYANYSTGRPVCTATGVTNLGGLIGSAINVGITNSYFDSDTSGITSGLISNPRGTRFLQSRNGYVGPYAGWNIDVDNADGNNNYNTGVDDPWDFGSSSQYPVLKYGFDGYGIVRQRTTGGVDWDRDDDNLIEVRWLTQLNAIRYDLEGDGKSTLKGTEGLGYAWAFPGQMLGMGCPDGCQGYELAADLDFDTGTAGDRTDDYYYNGGVGWTPIGDAGAPYTGEFHGRGYEIRNLYINSTTSVVAGLFGVTAGDSVIAGVGLPAVDITAALTNDNTGADAGVTLHAGALAAVMGGSTVIRSSYSTGSISLAGAGAGTVGIRAGGLLGDIDAGTVASSWSSVAVTAASGTTAGTEQVGGLAGIASTSGGNTASIIASYATGAVTADRNDCAVGGLFGVLWQGSSVTGSYAIGAPGCSAAGTTNVGGLVGAFHQTPTVTDSYWDATASGVSSSAGGVSKTTSELRTPTAYGAASTDIYRNWNLNLDGETGNDDPWHFGSASDYPILQYDRDAVGIDRQINPGGAAVDYDGDDDNLIDLGSGATGLAQLDAIRYDLDGDGASAKGADAVHYAKAFPGLTRGMGCPVGCQGYELQNHLDFDTDGDGDVDANDPGSYTNWAPIGTASGSYDAEFAGHGYTIANLTISRSGTDDVGLFGVAGTAAEIIGVGLPGVAVTGDERVGALVGTLRGEVSGSWSLGSVTGTHTVGGLVGRIGQAAADSGTASVNASYSRATVTASTSPGNTQTAGGLAGRNYAAITTSYAAGQVSSANNPGGLVGYTDGSGSIASSYWDSNVQASSSGGGAGLTTANMQSPTAYGATSSDTYNGWNTDVDGQGGADDPWDFGHSGEYPVLKYGAGRSLIKQERDAIVLSQSGAGINALAVDEGASAGVSYAVALADPPTAGVTVTVARPAGNTAVTIDDGTGTFGADRTLTFSTANWNQAQTVTVQAADDTNLVDETVALTHTGDDATSGTTSGYDDAARTLNITVSDTTMPRIVLTRNGNAITSLPVVEQAAADVTYNVALSHEPTAGVTVTVASSDSSAIMIDGPDADTTFSGSETMTFTAADYGVRQVTVRGVNDGDDVSESVTLTHTAANTTSSDSGYGSISRNLTVNVTDNDTPNLVVNETTLSLNEDTTGNGHQDDFTVRLNTLPTGMVTVDIASSNSDVELSSDGGTTYGSSVSLTFNAAAPNIWSANQTVNVQARDDADGEDDVASLTFSISGGNYGSVTQSAITVNVADNDDKGITFDPTSLTGVNAIGEGTDTGSYTVKLDTQPTAAVTVSISSNNSDVTIRWGSSGSFGSSASLSFSTTNWATAQTVTVRAAEDNDSANDTATLTHTGSGGGYGDGATGPLTDVTGSMSVTVTDNDTPGINLSRTALTITEEAARQTYTVRLNTQPSATVTVAVTKTNDDVKISADDSDYNSPVSLSFGTGAGAGGWNTPQTVYVKAEDDADGEGDADTLTHNPSGGDYGSVSDTTLALTITDDDTKAIVLNPTSLSSVNEGTDNTTYTVRLATEPTANVTVAVSSDNAAVRVRSGAGSFGSTASLAFSTTNWNDTQTVTVEAVNDDNSVSENVTISHIGNGGGYGDPDNTGPLTAVSQDLSVGVADDDTPSLRVSASSVSLNEATTGNGNQGSFNVRLNTQPTGTVTVRIESSNSDVQVRTGSGSYGSSVSLSFTGGATGNYGTDQAVNVRAGQDLDGDNDTASLSFTISGGDYDSVTQTAVSVTVTDDDPKGITLSETGNLAVSEGAAAASYTVVLDTQPSDTARVAVSSSDPSRVSVSRRSGGGFGSRITLSFNRTNYSAAQTVYARGNADDDTVSETGLTIGHTASGGGYAGIAASLSVALTDTSTPGLVISPSPLDIKESTDRDYAVRLTTQPASAVTVTIRRDAGSAGIGFDANGDGTFATAGSESLTFNSGNWNAPQAVKVRAPADVSADTTATLSHAASGADYGSVSGNLTVNVRDNRPPVAEAGADQQAYSGQTITLAGSAADPDDAVSTLRYAWRQSAGAPEVSLAGANTARPSFTVPTTLTADTTVQFELTVTDPSGRTDTDTVRATLLAARPNELVSLRVIVDESRRPLAPPFASIRRSFAASVGPYATTARIILTPADAAATVSLARNAIAPDAAGVRAATVNLAEGSNRYTIVVTPAPVAQGSSDAPLPPVIYVLNIRRQPVPRLALTPARIRLDEGATATYTVNLDTRWLGAEVTVAIASDHPAVTVSPDTVRFTPTDWAPRTITVTAAQDDDGADDAASINHRASGGHFDNVYGRVRVEIADDDGDGTVRPTPTPAPTPTPGPGATPTPTPTPEPTPTPAPPPGLPTVSETNMAEALLDGHTVTIIREAGSLWGVTVALPAALTGDLAITIAPLPADIPRSSSRFGLGMTDAAQSGATLTVTGAPAGGLELCLPLPEQLVSEAGDRPLTLVRYDAAAGAGQWQMVAGAARREMSVCAAGVSGGTYAAAYIITLPLGPASALTVSASDAPGTLTLRWTPGAQARMHWVAGIKQSDWDAGDFSSLIWTAASASNTHTLTGLDRGAEYVFAVAAGRRVDGVWEWSAWTALARGTPD